MISHSSILRIWMCEARIVSQVVIQPLHSSRATPNASPAIRKPSKKKKMPKGAIPDKASRTLKSSPIEALFIVSRKRNVPDARQYPFF